MSQLEKQQRSANAVSGKTARSCDSCLRRRARWYCVADDAFLCQACDVSVHSANPLARRHDRVSLKTSSSFSPSALDSTMPTWHQGFKRKARTPRPHHHDVKSSAMATTLKPMPLVPDLAEEEEEVEEEEQQLLYRVPVFDPVLAEFCSPPPLDTYPSGEEVNQLMPADYHGHGNFVGFNPSDIELEEFAAGVESLGQGLDDDSFSIDGLGFVDAREDDTGRVKMELDVFDMVGGSSSSSNKTTYHVDMEMEFSREYSLDIKFDCGLPTVGEEVEVAAEGDGSRKVSLRLDYESVIAAWSCRGCSPWTDGERPQFNLDDCWPDFTGMWGGGGGGGEVGFWGQLAGVGDGGREARVTRYREKRRTRLFSKKIRYEVRKLNAEKRPRMKGRFVKQTTAFSAAAGPSFPYV